MSDLPPLDKDAAQYESDHDAQNILAIFQKCEEDEASVETIYLREIDADEWYHEQYWPEEEE